MRDNNEPNPTKIGSEKFWDSLRDPVTRKSIVETYEEDPNDVFRMPTEEWEKLRFRISNKTLRLVECYNHPKGVVFGFRLHPPHLWNLREGVLYKKVGGKWVRFQPRFEENLERFND